MNYHEIMVLDLKLLSVLVFTVTVNKTLFAFI